MIQQAKKPVFSMVPTTNTRKYLIKLGEPLTVGIVSGFVVSESVMEKGHQVKGFDLYEDLANYSYPLWPFAPLLRRHKYIVLDDGGIDKDPIYHLFELSSRHDIKAPQMEYKLTTSRQEITEDVIRKAAGKLNGYCSTLLV